MYGVFRLKPNDRNVRDLDIEVDVDFQVNKMGCLSTLKNISTSLGRTLSNIREEQVQDAVRNLVPMKLTRIICAPESCLTRSHMICMHGSDYVLHPLYSPNHANTN